MDMTGSISCPSAGDTARSGPLGEKLWPDAAGGRREMPGDEDRRWKVTTQAGTQALQSLDPAGGQAITMMSLVDRTISFPSITMQTTLGVRSGLIFGVF